MSPRSSEPRPFHVPGRIPERWRGSPDAALLYLRQLPALTLIEGLTAPVLAVTSGGSIGYANAAFAGMLGYPGPEFLQGVMVNEIAGADSRCTVPSDQLGLLSRRAGAVTTWTHAGGHPVSTVVSVMRLRVFDPLTVLILTETADGTPRHGRRTGGEATGSACSAPRSASWPSPADPAAR